MSKNHLNNDALRLHSECTRLLRRESKQKIIKEVRDKMSGKDPIEYEPSLDDTYNNENCFIKILIYFCKAKKFDME
jgi:hypothetical protein